MNIRQILYVVGIMLCILASSMFLPLMADLYIYNADWKVFLLCMICTAFFGGILTLSNTSPTTTITHRQGFLMITICWVLLSLFAALPFWFSNMGISFTDSFFEAVSGLTTTGSTVLTGLDNAPRGILLWRALLQWLGGIGGILMAMSILPFLKIGGMQIFETELSEGDSAMPRSSQMISTMGGLYLILTGVNVLAYHLAGLDLFDSLAHAMTTISTGGFSTHDSPFVQHNTIWVKLVAIVFMLIGSLPFILYLKAMRGNLHPLFTDTQVRCFLAIVAVSIMILIIYLVSTRGFNLEDAFLHASFNVVSVITGTGFAYEDYGAWGDFSVALFLFLMVIGACAGSTTCGIKVFRFQILYSVTDTQIRKLMYPHGVFIPHYNRRPVPESVTISVMTFFFLYALSFSLVALALSFTGMDFLTAMSGSATSISNVGPGLGNIIGPVSTFKTLPDDAKWILSVAMLMGRLELFPVLVMMSPQFWRK